MQICQVIGMGHPREGAWINARTGECRFIHDWAKRPGESE